MMRMLAFDPRRRPRAVELERDMRVDLSNGLKIAKGVFDAFDSLVQKENPSLWGMLYPHVSLQK
jgi:hypothetical protein